jgi:hypothetical protein
VFSPSQLIGVKIVASLLRGSPQILPRIGEWAADVGRFYPTVASKAAHQWAAFVLRKLFRYHKNEIAGMNIEGGNFPPPTYRHLQQSGAGMILEQLRIADVGLQNVHGFVATHITHFEDGCAPPSSTR